MLDIVVHHNVRLSEITVSDTLDSDHLPITFHMQDHVWTRDSLVQMEMFTYWDRFQLNLFRLNLQLTPKQKTSGPQFYSLCSFSI